MHYCLDCGRHRAQNLGGKWRTDKEHTLCRQCWRSLRDSLHAHVVARSVDRCVRLFRRAA